MPEGDNLKKHLIFNGRFTAEVYTSRSGGGDSFDIKQRNPSEHGQTIKDKLVQIKTQTQATTAQHALHEDVVYLDFLSDLILNLHLTASRIIGPAIITC